MNQQGVKFPSLRLFGTNIVPLAFFFLLGHDERHWRREREYLVFFRNCEDEAYLHYHQDLFLVSSFHLIVFLFFSFLFFGKTNK